VYKQEYLDRLTSVGKSIIGMRVWDKTAEVRTIAGGTCVNESEVASSVIDSIKDFDVVYFLRELSEKIGLIDILREAMPGV
jgi:hypothetical protein